LTNKSAVDQFVLADEAVKINIFVNLNDGLGTIKLVEENLHLWRNY